MTDLLKTNINIVVDSNVWISALIFGGNSRKVFEQSISSNSLICVSEELLNETRRIVLRKFKSFQPDLESFILALESRIYKVNLGSIFIDICRDPNDNFIIETAVISKSTYIISGDKDLLSLKNYKKIKIITPLDFIKLSE